MTKISSTETDTKNVATPLISAIFKSGKIIYILIFVVIGYFGYRFFTQANSETSLENDTNLIQTQIKNVGKLVVTEGHFSEVFTYKDKKKTYIPGLTFDKKALVIINAEVTVSFDLSQIIYDIDSVNKVLKIVSIPKEEIKIHPKIKYYDTESSTFNEFTGDDYNKIAIMANDKMSKQIQGSTLKTNAKNRLLSEISKMLIVTNSMGWKLVYDGTEVVTEKDLMKKL